jgi:predicted transcriptional regulator YheO
VTDRPAAVRGDAIARQPNRSRLLNAWGTVNGWSRLSTHHKETREMSTQGNTLKSVDTTFKIIKHLRTKGAKTVTELSKELDMPKSTVQVYLNSLYSDKFVVREGEKLLC